MQPTGRHGLGNATSRKQQDLDLGNGARDVAVIALMTSLLMWLVAFLDVGGEWFLMWQSQIWNGQEEAFRMFTIVGVVFLVVVQREPTPD